jgi:hypothetical protein
MEKLRGADGLGGVRRRGAHTYTEREPERKTALYRASRHVLLGTVLRPTDLSS